MSAPARRLERVTTPTPAAPAPGVRLQQDEVTLPGGGPTLALRTGPGRGRPVLLVHGLASNARVWDGVAVRLLAAGHQVIAVDQRGHGRSEQVATGYDTGTCADDLAALIGSLGLTGERRPVVAGQSWGGNVVLSLAARHAGVVAGVCCVDGGWIRPGARFDSFDDCWAALAPPRFEELSYTQVADFIRSAHPDWPVEGVEGTLANLVELPGGGVRARLDREHHRSILRSLYEGDPRLWYPQITVPVLLCPAVPADDADPDDAERSARAHSGIEEALAALPDAQVSWYRDADHDVHAQHPDRLATDLLGLLARAEEAPGNGTTREG